MYINIVYIVRILLMSNLWVWQQQGQQKTLKLLDKNTKQVRKGVIWTNIGKGVKTMINFGTLEFSK